MTYRGQVKNGQIVLDNGARLGEGAIVEITEVRTAPSAPRGSAAAILASRARWVGAEDEAERILDEMKRQKWAEVESQRGNGTTLPDRAR